MPWLIVSIFISVPDDLSPPVKQAVNHIIPMFIKGINAYNTRMWNDLLMDGMLVPNDGCLEELILNPVDFSTPWSSWIGSCFWKWVFLDEEALRVLHARLW